MVDLGKRKERGVEEVMEVGPPRSRPLHNFKMPRLKWGNQQFLRCMNVNPNGEIDRRCSALEVEKGLIGRRRESERERRRGGWIERRVESFRKSPAAAEAAAGGGGSGKKSRAESDGDGGIEAVREKLMFDLQAAADKMKDAILREGLEEEEEPPPAVAPAPAETDDASRPWNLRTRRAACKAPNGMNGAIGGGGGTVNGDAVKGLRVDVRKPSFSPLRNGSKSPRLGGDFTYATSEKGERPEFSVSLSRREIEEDFRFMTGNRPPRRPKKRHRNVQKQLDTLFPGLWLTEITADIYKVPDAPEAGKR